MDKGFESNVKGLEISAVNLDEVENQDIVNTIACNLFSEEEDLLDELNSDLSHADEKFNDDAFLFCVSDYQALIDHSIFHSNLKQLEFYCSEFVTFLTKSKSLVSSEQKKDVEEMIEDAEQTIKNKIQLCESAKKIYDSSQTEHQKAQQYLFFLKKLNDEKKVSRAPQDVTVESVEASVRLGK